jgi:four helix bundle protein
MKENVIVSKTYQFALRIISVCRQMESAREYVLSRQLLRSGTSIGANVEEAQAAQSRADFISKMSIAAKEARETRYWLRLLRDSDLLPSIENSTPLAECEEILLILTSIVKTTSEIP